MAKVKAQFQCSECGYLSPKWLGRCPECGQWNSLEEQIMATKGKSNSVASGLLAQPTPLNQVDSMESQRQPTGLSEVDRVLGGGFMPGSLLLLSGDPGIGKSTLVLQLLGVFKESVLYISGEESRGQIKNRAERLGIEGKHIYVVTENNLLLLDQLVRDKKPALVVVDSVQTVMHPEVSSAQGSVGQLRAISALAMEWAKNLGIITLLIGHVTKDGSVAGPKVLEHMVDTVLFLEGDRHYHYRVLRALKNRFGSTQEIGLFDMSEQGMQEVTNPSSAFLAERLQDIGGSAVACTLEGSRPILLEIQSLVVTSYLSNPRRMTTGADFNRVSMLIAVLEKRAGLALSNQDVYLNVVGGLRIGEPAADLAIALAIASAQFDKPLPADVICIGEVGLSGEVRSVPQLERRIIEAANLGFKQAIVPKNSEVKAIKGFTITKVAQLAEAIDTCME